MAHLITKQPDNATQMLAISAIRIWQMRLECMQHVPYSWSTTSWITRKHTPDKHMADGTENDQGKVDWM